MTPARFVVFGEALTDFIREGPNRWTSAAGGAPWNVARAAARLGLATAYAGGISGDPFGDELWRLAEEAGVDLRLAQRVSRPTLLAMVISKAPPVYFFVGDDSADQAFDPARLPARWLDEAEVVFFGGISLLRQPYGARLLELVERVRAAGKRICVDPNYRSLLSRGFRETALRVARVADYVKVSDEDLTGMFPGQPPEEGLHALRLEAPRAHILFTRGAHGMRLLSPAGEVAEQPAYPVQVVDTVGAGDACVGAWMASLLAHPDAPLRAHASFAAAAAAVSCSHAGAHAPSQEEVRVVQAREAAGPSP
ncbi:MAG TPA: carbohydrate kinase [Anaeromyxobacter sp.]|nr:carbohydrate kinase [Anaeromyxobacter sp.]